MEKEYLIEGKIACEEAGIEKKTSICGACGGFCLVDLYMKDGKVIKVEGNDSLPYSNGKICVKGAALKQFLYSPERLLYPMKRVGERGEGKFERISWEEALDTIAEKMKKTKEEYGARETMLYVGHPKWFRNYLTDFANLYGTPNFASESSTCAYALFMAMNCGFGKACGMPVPDLRNAKTVLVWGVNPSYSNPATSGQGFLSAVERGLNIIVVDPRMTPTSQRATLHLRPIPGTDGALALGMANVIINEHLEATEYIENHTHGYEAYKEYVMQFTPAKASEITGVPEADIIRAARMYAGEGPASLMMSASPVVHNINGFQNARAITLLMALTGNFGVPGGNFAPGPSRTPLYRGFMMEKVWRNNPRGDLSFEEFPLWNTLVPEVQVSRMADYLMGLGAYPQRTLVAFGMNHHMWPRPDRVEEALKGLDFFVNADIYMNDTCKYADIVLPITPQPERESIELIGPMVYYQPEVVKPQGEAKNDMEVLIELGKRLGFYMDQPEIHNYEEYLEARIQTTGLTLEELRQHPEGMKAKVPLKMRKTEDILKVLTPTGKIEFESTFIADMFREDHEPLPVYHDFREKLPLEEYPLILSTGSRKPQLFHSRCYRIPWLNNLEEAPLLEIHPQDAKALQIEEGEVVTLKTPIGSMDFTAVYHAGCLKGTVNVYHGAGEKDINYILDDLYLDPISGFPGFKSYCCKLEKKEV